MKKFTAQDVCKAIKDKQILIQKKVNERILLKYNIRIDRFWF